MSDAKAKTGKEQDESGNYVPGSKEALREVGGYDLRTQDPA